MTKLTIKSIRIKKRWSVGVRPLARKGNLLEGVCDDYHDTNPQRVEYPGSEPPGMAPLRDRDDLDNLDENSRMLRLNYKYNSLIDFGPKLYIFVNVHGHSYIRVDSSIFTYSYNLDFHNQNVATKFV